MMFDRRMFFALLHWQPGQQALRRVRVLEVFGMI